MGAHLDLQPDPAAGAAILIHDDTQIRGRVALHSPVAHVHSAVAHRGHLLEGQRLHACEKEFSILKLIERLLQVPSC